MRVYLGRLTLHENLYFATREIGRLYETGRYLHNYALTFALGLANAPYFNAEQKPSYAEHLSPLNERGIYVTPARGVAIDYMLSTFKYANNAYHVEMTQGSRNTPSFGRAKEIAVGSVFEFAVLSEREMLKLPRWIRLGLWRSKAEIAWTKVEDAAQKLTAMLRSSLPLNPLDVSSAMRSFDLISMPPSSLVDHALLQTDWWVWDKNNKGLPAHMKYTFPETP